jgi:hypothetical protein
LKILHSHQLVGAKLLTAVDSSVPMQAAAVSGQFLPVTVTTLVQTTMVSMVMPVSTV